MKSFNKTKWTEGLFVAMLIVCHGEAAPNTNLTTLQVSAGNGHTLAVRSDGTVWASGDNGAGQLGQPSSVHYSTFPLRIAGITNAIGVAAGTYHSLVVLRDGRVFACGTNDQGQLGNNTLVSSSTPVQVSNLTNAIAVAANYLHSMALLADGTLRCWGDNAYGQLGNNNVPTDSKVPVAVSGNNLTNIVGIGAGGLNSIALRGDGTVWSWGDSTYGQLGNPSYTSSPIPVQVTALSTAKAISAGYFHSLAVNSNGTVFAWGSGIYGELGLGISANTNYPTQVPSVSNVVTAAASIYGSLVLQSSGAILAWGYSGASSSLVPIWVDRAPFFNAISQGNGYSIGVTYSGSVYAWGANTVGQFGNDTISYNGGDFAPSYCFGPFPLSESGRFGRGFLEKPQYTSMVLPFNEQRGVRLDDTGTNSYEYGLSTPWFTRIQTQTRYQPFDLSTGTNVIRFPVVNPVAAFGRELGGTPLYLNQSYAFGAFAGSLNEALTASTGVFRIIVYDRTKFAGSVTNNIAALATNSIYIPRRTVSADAAAWGVFITNGFSTTLDAFGLKTTVEFEDGRTNDKPWGLQWFADTNGYPRIITNFDLVGYKLTHVASSTATNYHFVVEGRGAIQTAISSVDYFATNSSGTWVPVPLYTLDFEARQPLRSIFVDQPQFDGTPLPPSYAGKTQAELNGLIASVTNTIWITNSSAYTSLDNSPELRSHPLLDQLVSDLGRDPLKLASFVINEIDLTDPVAVSGTVDTNSTASTLFIQSGGINRSALGTFLERQGSAAEQCALLVYLLRKAGYPAAYVWPNTNNLQLFDFRVSKLLRMQVKGAPSPEGEAWLTSTLVTINYPWVVLNLGGTRSLQIFPWLKDTRIVEGLNLYDYMPTNYNNGYLWAKDYVLGKTNILNLDPEHNSPWSLFPKFVTQYLQTNAPGISIDDLGVRAFNQRNQFARWEDLPIPNIFQNQSQVTVVTNLSASQAFLANIFNTFQVQVYSGTNTSGTKVLDSGSLRMVDLNDRKFLLLTNTPTTLELWLAGYRPGTTTTSAFNDAALTNIEQITYIFGSQSNFTVQFIHHRHQAAQPNWRGFLYAAESLTLTNVFPYNVSDLAGIAVNVGRVTPPMLRPHIDSYTLLERQKATNSSFLPAIEDYQGTVAFLLGMGWYEKLGRFQELNLQLHRTSILSMYGNGLSRLISWMPSGTRKVQGAVDMGRSLMVTAANWTSRPDLDEGLLTGWKSFMWLDNADASAQEHEIINSTLEEKYAISTVRLLQLAQKRATNGNAGVLELTKNNYVAAGNSAQTGWGATLLKNQDNTIWASVSNSFTGWDADYARVFITPGKVTNEVKSYIGMGAFIVRIGEIEAALISGNSVPKNGGAGDLHPDFSASTGTTLLPYSEVVSPEGDVTYHNNGTEITTGRDVFTADEVMQMDSGSQTNAAPSVNAALPTIGNLLNRSGFVATEQGAEDIGFTGQPDDRHSLGTTLADPVNVLTGEFYIDAADLTLPGPFPLQIRRNYGSQNLADNQFGFGWKMSLMPFLTVTTNATNGVIIYAAEMDGSVVAYRKQANDIYLVNPQDNPTLNNNSSKGIGSTANWFNARIERYTNSSQIYYRLTGSDGSIRSFRQRSDFGVNTGASTLSRIRPYLDTWQDNRGNTLTFTFGTNSAANDYGQPNRIESSSGSFLGFYYDVYGRIIETYAGDGRRLIYTYDKLGDLTKVTLPDESEISYQYQHSYYTITNTGVISTNLDSNHLMVEEDKPDGRILQNVYDANRRVTSQLSTVGPDLRLYVNATFIYSNSPDTTNFISTLTGKTVVKDFFNNATTYYYRTSLITNITDPLGRTTSHQWYADNATAPGYPRGLMTKTDPRNLSIQYGYDPFGNVTNMTISGPDLSGGGATNSVSTASYNTNNLILESVDPAGTKLQYIYSTNYLFLPVQITRLAGTAPTSTNYMTYYNVSNVISDGINSFTNQSFGLLQREVRGSSATNEWAYDGRGFITNQTQYPLTADFASTDPIVRTSFFYNQRSELEEKDNSIGWKTKFDYDGLGRPKWREVYDETGTALSREYTYFNGNGELVWYDGPAYDPEDYVWRDYDGAGRKTQEVHWRSRGRQDGSGVEAETGDDLFATTFYFYDGFGNLTNVIDPKGNYVARAYDSVGQMTREVFYAAVGTALATNTYGYEPGGLVAFKTNSLGGVTQKQYTSMGQLKFQQNPDGSTLSLIYYLDGRVYKEYQPNGAFWRTVLNDPARIVTRTFWSASIVPLATITTELDARGNLVRRVDAAGNSFTNVYDGLNRLKFTAGPIMLHTNVFNFPPAPPPTQQAVTNYYDAAGQVLTVLNALGEKTVTTKDPLGRTVNISVYSSDGTLLRNNATVYAPNHHSYTTTAGSGSAAISNAVFTDNDGQGVLTLNYPSSGVMEFTWQAFDVGGNRTQSRECSMAKGVVTTWASNSWTFDGLNRVKTETILDGATTTSSYDGTGNLTSQAMPGGLTWTATYTNDGRILLDYDSASGIAARTNRYTYYPTGVFSATLLQTRIDGRGVTNNYAYDDWMHVIALTSTGSLPEQNVTTTWQYDARQLLTQLTEYFATNATGSSSSIVRSYDPYGLLIQEAVRLDGALVDSSIQAWDSAGRRVSLSFQDFGYAFNWRADGLVGSVISSRFNKGGAYTYDNAGQLTSRVVGSRTTTVNQRDGLGRPLSLTTTVSGVTQLTEALTWREDGRLLAHTVGRIGDFTNQQAYAYADGSRRLATEQLNLDAAHTWTNSYTYDNGQAASLGVLTKATQPSSAANWSGAVDSLSRVKAETNAVASRSAYGNVNGPASVTAVLDGEPVVVATVINSNGGQWRANLELTSGTHQLIASALHPSGLFTNTATTWFTNKATLQTTTNTLDLAGNISKRVWLDGSNNIIHTQNLLWDGRGRLFKVTDRDAFNNGSDWVAAYDALGRRLRTTSTTITTNVTNSAFATTINQFYDPAVRFLELGVMVNGVETWKLYGPDASGTYGGMQGMGGLEAVAPPPDLFCPLAPDIRGNLHAVYDSKHLGLAWFSSRLTGYGAVPGYRPQPLGFGADLASSSAWRACWGDITGYYCRGFRYYDPIAGHWLSADPKGHSASPSLYDFCAGDPINKDDPDGRIAKGFLQGSQAVNSSPANSSWAFNAAYWVAGMSASTGEGFLRGAQGEVNAISFGTMRGTLNESWEEFGMANNEGDSAFRIGQGSGKVAIGALTLATGVAALEVPSLAVAATAAAYSPWAPVVGGGLAMGAYTYSQGGSAGDVVFSTVAGAGMTYMASPFPMGGQNAPPRTISQPGNLYSRGSFRVGTVNQGLAEVPINEVGQPICPTCQEIIPPTITIQTVNGPVTRRGFDLDHYPITWAERVQQMKAQPVPPTRQEVLDIYNQDVRVLCPACNQGHEFEGEP